MQLLDHIESVFYDYTSIAAMLHNLVWSITLTWHIRHSLVKFLSQLWLCSVESSGPDIDFVNSYDWKRSSVVLRVWSFEDSFISLAASTPFWDVVLLMNRSLRFLGTISMSTAYRKTIVIWFFIGKIRWGVCENIKTYCVILRLTSSASSSII